MHYCSLSLLYQHQALQTLLSLNDKKNFSNQSKGPPSIYKVVYPYLKAKGKRAGWYLQTPHAFGGALQIRT